MEDIILLDAIERYVNGTILPEELEHFENLRKSNPEIDQLVVDHSFFLKKMDVLGDRKHFRSTLDSVHAELVSNHQIVVEENQDTKVVSLFSKYRKKLAIAATVISLATIGTLGVIFAYNKGKKDSVETTEVGKKYAKKIADLENDMKVVKDATKKKYINPTTSGTGFIVNEKGYLLTNYHVIENAKNVYVYSEKYGDLEAEVFLTDKTNDLAVIKITDTLFKAVPKFPYSFKNTELGLGQRIYTLGYCRPPSLTYNEGFVSSKSVNATLDNKQNFLLTLQVDAGNSGSPILNSNGDLVGIVSAKENLENGFTLGIKPSTINNIMNFLNNEISVKSKTSYNQLKGLSIDNQIKKVQDYIFMVKVK
jgi:S1-C subfamily serine protease